MKKLWKFLDNHLLEVGIIFLLLFVPLYPKLPSVHIIRTWVYIRLEDFSIAFLAIVWGIQVIRRKISIPLAPSLPIFCYWLIGFMSFLYSVIVLAPHLANFFPHVAFLQYARRIEYMVLFFIALSTITGPRVLKHYLIALSVALVGIIGYGIGQKYYISLWHQFPAFFEKYPFCFPSFQTGNEEFAKGIPLCLPPDARTTSTFGGHYDLAAYLVIVIPLLAALFFAVKRKITRLGVFILFLLSVVVLILTASRISFVSYIFGTIMMLTFYKKKKFIVPLFVFSIALLLMFSSSTAKRFLDTIRLTSIVTNSQGQIVGESVSNLPSDLQKKISKNPVVVGGDAPSQNLPVGSGFIALPSTRGSSSTNSAVVRSQISEAEARRLKLQFGGVEISTISGSFLVQKALVYDISFTTRFQAEWPNAWQAFLRDPVLGSGYSSITLASDNDYVRALGETGFLGLASFLFIFVIFGIILRTALPSIQEQLPKAYLVGVAGGVLGLFANAVLIDVFEASKVAETLWILVGIGIGIAFYYYKGKISYQKSLKAFFTSHTLIVLFLLLLLCIAFLPGIGNFFVADDFTWLHWAASGSLSSLGGYFTDATNFFYRPIPKTLIFFLYTFFSFLPQGYHIFTLILHFLTTVGVYLLAYKIFGKKLYALLSAILFLFLPAHGEIIFWFATISTTLATLFIVYGLIAFLSWRNTGSKKSLFFVFILYILSLLSYEMSIVFPLLCFITDIFLVEGKKKKWWVVYIPLVLFVPGYYELRSVAHSFSGGNGYSYNLAKLLPNTIGNYLGYFGFMVFGQTFMPLYTSLRNELKTYVIPITGGLVFIVIVLSILFSKMKKRIIVLLQKRDAKIILYSVAFTFVSLMTFLGLGNIAERYVYLSSVGYVIGLVTVLALLCSFVAKIVKQKARTLLILLIVVISTVYYFQLAIQRKDWEKAGIITRNTLAVFRVDYESIPQYANIFVVNTPIKKAEAWIFPIGLDDGLWFIYRDPTIHLVPVKDIAEARRLKKQAEATSLVKNYIFVFDKNDAISEVKE